MTATAQSYETGRDPESAADDQRRSRKEVWLRGNVRPVLVLAGAAAIVFAVPTALLAGGPWWPAVWGAGAITALAVTGMAVVASWPRLMRTGDSLSVRLSPTRVEILPLEVAECFFPGSHPLTRRGAQTCEHHAIFRVNTLVLRVAERAEPYHRRKTFTPWGTWDDGYIVFDGRWCEPLSPGLARRLGGLLVEARRGLGGGTR